jgi:hypothetical protein
MTLTGGAILAANNKGLDRIDPTLCLNWLPGPDSNQRHGG